MGRRVWMTRQMIVDKYKSESVADRIITNKLANEDTKKSQTKAHPDDPDNEAVWLHEIGMHCIASLCGCITDHVHVWPRSSACT